MRRPTLVRSLAASSILLDAVAVGGWYATRELDDRPQVRRRVRTMLIAGAATVVVAQAVGDLAWHRPDPDGVECDDRLLPREDAVAYRRYGGVALVATALLWPIEKRAPVALSRRGVSRPYLAFGVLAGTAYALATAPVWILHARDRLDARPAIRPGGPGQR